MKSIGSGCNASLSYEFEVHSAARICNSVAADGRNVIAASAVHRAEPRLPLRPEMHRSDRKGPRLSDLGAARE